ncbi:divergent PAP2 family protein [Alicyclobacillus pomorum]|jgi:acid phosphatase family membrane protein YuiD|uniref:divergent PAP2 family protein n=1 Tax=Alicyclobacillus pomorum TaxID=204470 RepID=UPI0004297733|nr:divergent PAP2 family protein [Alicyclobacillus pomorum]
MLGNGQYIWISPLLAMMTAQVLKPLLIMLRLRRWDWQLMRRSGGMPSSHTALVVALVAELWLRYGGDDPVLGIAIFVALVVMYDAAGVRWQTGRQAAVLNRLLHELKTSAAESTHPSAPASVAAGELRPIPVAKSPWWLVDWPVLDEHVGHKPVEVLGGVIVGLLVVLILH